MFSLFDKDHLIGLGINKREAENNYYKYFNSFSVFDHQLNLIDNYNKIKLVPFGEILPFESIMNKVGLKIITNNIESFSKGNKRDFFEINIDKEPLKFLPLICYEIIYSGKLTKDFNFDFILNISEDGWFGKSIGPSQHFTHSIFRAIEEGKSVIRSSNNGISAIIGPKGKVIKIHESTEGGVLITKKFEKINKLTIFSTYGRNNIFFYLALIYISLIFFLKRTGR